MSEFPPMSILSPKKVGGFFYLIISISPFFKTLTTSELRALLNSSNLKGTI